MAIHGRRLGMLMAAWLLAACGGDDGAPRTKAGAKPVAASEVKRLKFVSHDQALLEDPGLLAFVRRVEERSGGRLVIDSHALPPDEDVADAVRKGRYDLGYDLAISLGERVPALAVPTLPFLIDSYALQQELLNRGYHERVLRDLRTIGLEGVALLPAELWRPFARHRPVLTAADLKASRMFTLRPGLYVRGLRATGLRTSPFTDAFAYVKDWDEGRANVTQIVMAGLQFSPAGGWGLVGTLNMSFGARSLAIFMNARAADRLDDRERAWLRAAAADATRASLRSAEEEARDLAPFCRKYGLRAALAEKADLAQIRGQALAYYRRRKERGIRAGVEFVERVKRTAPVDRHVLPKECEGPLPAGLTPVAENRDPNAIDGTYRFTTTAEANLAAGVPDRATAADIAGTYTVTMKGGIMKMVRRSRETSTGSEPQKAEGYYRVTGNRVSFLNMAGPVSATFERLPDGSLRWTQPEGIKQDPYNSPTLDQLWRRVR